MGNSIVVPIESKGDLRTDLRSLGAGWGSQYLNLEPPAAAHTPRWLEHLSRGLDTALSHLELQGSLEVPALWVHGIAPLAAPHLGQSRRGCLNLSLVLSPLLPGVRYNAEKKKVGNYYTTPIYR